MTDLATLQADALQRIDDAPDADALETLRVDNTLTGCPQGIRRFRRFLARRHDFGFIVATGRSIVEARRLVRDWGLPQPLAWITSVGTEIYVQDNGALRLDDAFSQIIRRDWDPDAIDRVVEDHPYLVAQPCYEQRAYKRSFFADTAECALKIEHALRDANIAARVVFSHGHLLDILPPDAGKAAAMRHVAQHFGVPSASVFAAGDSGNDVDMLTACENAILVANHAEEVASLANRSNVYRAQRGNAAGALEGVLAHHRARQLRARQPGVVSA